jgi:competence protein ComEA
MPELPEEGEGRKNAAVAAALIGVILLGAGWFVWRADAEPEMEIIKVADKAEETSTKIKVDVEGAVNHPGVYVIKEGDRINDVIGIAGGLTADADVNWIELHINKAEKVTDGYKLYVPRKGEAEKNEVAGKNTTGIISINFSTQAELESLPGVGEVTAGKIIQGRPYSQIKELVDKKIITQKVFDGISTSIGL